MLQSVAVDDDDVVTWSAEHDGYLSLETPTVHRRAVILDRVHRELRIEDCLDGPTPQDIRLVYHLGPDVGVVLDGSAARLEWPTSGVTAFATAELPDALDWSVHVGETGPVLGWYSRRFGQKSPIATMVGHGRVAPATPLTTTFEFLC